MTSAAPIVPEQVTIAVTVYSRKDYIKQAVSSALQQTIPVRVIVVEDCGPDKTLQDFVKAEFGDRIHYVRNRERRGLFGNWNACLQYCTTEWLSILHDDDYLTPNFVSSMIALSRHAPGCALYFGQSQMVDEQGRRLPEWDRSPMNAPWRRLTLDDAYYITPFFFAGQLFRADQARALGGFRATSQYAGDWEMWANLIAAAGAAETIDHVACTRSHGGADRGCNVIWRTGKAYGLSYVQHKRVIALLNQKGGNRRLDRREMQKRFPTSTQWLLDHGCRMSWRLLRYNVGLLTISPSPHWRHAVLKYSAAFFRAPFVFAVSQLWCTVKRMVAPLRKRP